MNLTPFDEIVLTWPVWTRLAAAVVGATILSAGVVVLDRLFEWTHPR